MTMTFRDEQRIKQIEWWKAYSNQQNWENEIEKWGYWGGIQYSHIATGDRFQLLWSGIQQELPQYLGNEIHPHSGTLNLLSSWVCSANLYFPARSIIPSNKAFNKLLLGFLQTKISQEIVEIKGIELEFALEDKLSPRKLLGEMDGNRGSGQTSPDVAFVVATANGGTGLILTECKYVEHSFYPCSARRTKDRGDKPGNPNPQKCMQSASNCEYKSIPCQQHVWKRKYLTHFQLSDIGKKQLKRCPAATSGYQLMRQQALANGIFENGKYEFVISSVSFDSRNKPLINCLSTSGIKDFQTDWTKIYNHGADFITWHHQDWVDYVRSNNTDPMVANWLEYMNERYGYK